LVAMMFGLMLSLKNEIVKISPRARINCIAPGLVKTPLAEEVLQNAEILYQSLSGYVPTGFHAQTSFPHLCASRTALKKVATTADVANQVVVISSQNLSGHVTGQVLYVEGGMDVRLLNSRQDLGLPPA
jgi:NAD(P)-dependent dehydrogenase (short-subunit alcohol dehydrogenase family)